MLSYESPRACRGFTLLELTVALASAALLVALLVGVWLQVVRSAEKQAHDAEVSRTRAELHRTLESVVAGAQWTANSQAPQGSLVWEQGEGKLVLWSREGLGRFAGPTRWWFQCDAEGLQAVVEDPQEGGRVIRRWSGVRRVQLECCRVESGLEGETIRWLPFDQWDVAWPFRPVGLRLVVEDASGLSWKVVSWT
ncbi:hypothetical protein [Geothrix sp. 21YS21S-4]|uniref:hypothetical protein n=1 Tax=Geothrix sp. 21YS21S-4 TaxID=3068889 RepID=UPI0027BA5965|nr:hypothetical protein [Geothrix sp. 21YS21S-4]